MLLVFNTHKTSALETPRYKRRYCIYYLYSRAFTVDFSKVFRILDLTYFWRSSYKSVTL